jgi:endonuclease YncB( thermonuclease family)
MSGTTRRVLLVIGLVLAFVPMSFAGAKDTRQQGAFPPRAVSASLRLLEDPSVRCASAAPYLRASARRPRYVPQDKIRIVDGDTFRNGRERVRIIGYDAPEMSQPRGPAAKARLTQLMRGGSVTMLRRGKDKYGRTLAFVYVDGKNVAEIMKSEGFVK